MAGIPAIDTVDMDASMEEILADEKNKADVLERLKDNWFMWAGTHGVDGSDASWWHAEMWPWVDWLRDVPDTLVGLRKSFDELNFGNDDGCDGLFPLLNYIQVYTGTAILDFKGTSPLTRVLRHLQEQQSYRGMCGSGFRARQTANVILYRDVENAKFMLTMKDARPGVNSNIIIRNAALNGNVPLVKALLDDPRVDPRDKENRTIQDAVMGGWSGVVELLLVDGRADTKVAVSALKRRMTVVIDGKTLHTLSGLPPKEDIQRDQGLREIAVLLSEDDRVDDETSCALLLL